MKKFKKGNFKWTGDNKVKFIDNENGKFNIQYWKPNPIQRFLYWTRILKDPRYNGEKAVWQEFDESGFIRGCDPFDKETGRGGK